MGQDYVYAIICPWPEDLDPAGKSILNFYQTLEEAQNEVGAREYKWPIVCVPYWKINPVAIVGTPEHTARMEACRKQMADKMAERQRKREEKRKYWREKKRESRANLAWRGW